MEKIFLAERVKTTTCRGNPLKLLYYLVCEQTPQGMQYGVEIRACENSVQTICRLPRLSASKARTENFLKCLARGTVTPVGLPDVVQDWL